MTPHKVMTRINTPNRTAAPRRYSTGATPRRSGRAPRTMNLMRQRRTHSARTAALPFKQRGFMKRVLFILTILCGALILLIWLQIQIDKTSQNINIIQQKILDQQSKNRIARSEIDKASTYEIISPIVKSRFGMEYPSTPKIIIRVPEEMLSIKK